VVCILHSRSDTPGTFEEYFLKNQYGFKVLIAPEMRSSDFVIASQADLLLVMGGAMGVYEQEAFPFLMTEIDLLKRRIDSDSPTLGICLGAQLLAAAANAKVYRSEKEEFGWFPLQATQDGIADPVIGNTFSVRTDPVFHWHQDTFELPVSCKNLLYSSRCTSQAFKVSQRIYGFQFHLELAAHELPDWIKSEPELSYGETPGVQNREAMISDGNRYGGSLKDAAFGTLSNFSVLL